MIAHKNKKRITAVTHCAYVAFNFANVFARCGSFDLHHLAGVFNLVELLIHHDNADTKTVAGVKSDYFC